jgi:hypothetical protein
MGNRQTGTRTKTDRDRDTDTNGHGQGHKRTWTGTQTDMDRDKYMDINNFNGQLTNIRALKALSFKNLYKIEF